MSNMKFSPDLFLGQVELDRFEKFIFEEGFKKFILQTTSSFGLIKNPNDSAFLNFKVELGTNSGTVKISEGLAIDSDANYILNDSLLDNIDVPNDGNYYWLKISHKFDNQEVGVVSVDEQGNLTGIGTKFTEVLRGQPDIPSVIKLLTSSLNSQEYEVLEVLDDENVVLQGDFQVESNLKYGVIGSFTPATIQTIDQKYPFDYDSVDVEFIQEVTSNTPPAYVDGKEFFIARVRLVGVNVTVEDKRKDIFRSTSDYKFDFFNINQTNIFGVEGVKFDNLTSPRSENVLDIAWGFRSTNFSFNTSLRLLTLNSGLGGSRKSVSQVSNNDFNGWRVYLDGSSDYFIIQQTQKSGTSLNLFLDNLDSVVFTAATKILIVPNVESIIIEATPDPDESNKINIVKVECPININLYSLKLPVYKSLNCNYNLKVRLKNNFTTTEYLIIEDSEYYNESAFDSQGNLTTPANVTAYSYNVNEGYILLTENTNSYRLFQSRVDIGDLQGYEFLPLDNTTPELEIRVGVNKKTVIIGDSITTPDSIILILDHYLNLSTEGAIEGNSFDIILNTRIFNGINYTFNIVQGYVNAGNVGTVKVGGINDLTIDILSISSSLRKRVKYTFVFDGVNWEVVHTSNPNPKVLSPELIPLHEIHQHVLDNRDSGWKNVSTNGAMGSKYSDDGLQYRVKNGILFLKGNCIRDNSPVSGAETVFTITDSLINLSTIGEYALVAEIENNVKGIPILYSETGGVTTFQFKQFTLDNINVSTPNVSVGLILEFGAIVIPLD